MKKLFLFLCLVPTLALGQVSSWRSNPPSSSSSNTTSQSRTTTSTSSWRNQSPTEFNRPPQKNPKVFFNEPMWGWNRWNMWGAPTFGWNYWSPFNYWNDWGYRQPARIYYYNDGRRDTIKGKKPIYSFGLQTTTDRQIGGFFAVGNKTYFILEYNSTFERDNSTFFPYGTISQVDFPLVNDLVKFKTFYGGVGKRFNRTGVHFMVGGVNEVVRYRGKDDLGYITFPKYIDNFMTVKVGVLHDIKNVSVKIDYDPIIRNINFGLGLNL